MSENEATRATTDHDNAARYKEALEVLGHIHHIAAGACDKDKDRMLLEKISEVSKQTLKRINQ